MVDNLITVQSLAKEVEALRKSNLRKFAESVWDPFRVDLDLISKTTVADTPTRITVDNLSVICPHEAIGVVLAILVDLLFLL